MDIKEIIKNIIKAALAEMGILNVEIELETPPDGKMGDIAFPCFNLSKIMRRSPLGETAAGTGKSPNEIATEIMERVKKGQKGEIGEKGEMNFKFQISNFKTKRIKARDTDNMYAIVERVEAQGGYVNFFYKRDVFLDNVLKEVFEKGEEYGKISNFKACPELAERVKSLKLGEGENVSMETASSSKNPLVSPFGKGGISRIMVEYSGPNTNKPLHLGHGRNSFLGMAVSNLLENAGAKVIKANIVNDRGAHICKSMLMYKMFGNGDNPEKSGLKGDHFVGKYYAMFGEKLKENSALEEEVKDMLRKWEAGDKEIMALWEKMNEWYYQGVEETYKKIGSEFDKYYYESEMYKYGREIVLDAIEKKIVYKKEDGAVAIDLTDDGLDEKILLRSDGTSVYITQDLYTAKIRFGEFNLDKLIYVVACEQNYHFKVLFKILERMGFKWAKNCYHLSYGMVNIPSGKLKSREGTKVDLDDLVENLKHKAMAAIKEKHKGREEIKTPAMQTGQELRNKEIGGYEYRYEQIPDNAQGKIPPNPPFGKLRADSLGRGGVALEERAMKIGIAALKFMLLKVGPAKSVMFNPEEAVSFEGDTGPYVLYAYTRIKSILRKVGGDFSVSIIGELDNTIKESLAYGKPHPSPLLKGEGAIVSDEEMGLAKMIYEFSEVLEKAAVDYNPANLANYLLELASAFNQFYHIHKVLDAETEELREMRIALIKSVAVVLKRGMEILGIEMVEEM